MSEGRSCTIQLLTLDEYMHNGKDSDHYSYIPFVTLHSWQWQYSYYIAFVMTRIAESIPRYCGLWIRRSKGELRRGSWPQTLNLLYFW